MYIYVQSPWTMVGRVFMTLLLEIRQMRFESSRIMRTAVRVLVSTTTDSGRVIVCFPSDVFFEVETLLIRSSRRQLLPCKEASRVSHMSCSACAASSCRSMFWDDVSHGHGCLWYDGWYGLWRLRWLWWLWRLWHDGCQMLRRS